MKDLEEKAREIRELRKQAEASVDFALTNLDAVKRLQQEIEVEQVRRIVGAAGSS